MAFSPAPTPKHRVLHALLDGHALTVASLTQLTGQHVSVVQHAVIGLRLQGLVTGKKAVALTHSGMEYARRVAETSQIPERRARR